MKLTDLGYALDEKQSLIMGLQNGFKVIVAKDGFEFGQLIWKGPHCSNIAQKPQPGL